MKPELKTEWVEALRSGRYVQGRGRLRRANRYCCLGVLADIIGLEWQLGPHFEVVDLGDDRSVKEDVIPERAANSIDLRQNTQSHLASLNDNGASFAEIADWIEENL